MVKTIMYHINTTIKHFIKYKIQSAEIVNMKLLYVNTTYKN